MSAIIFSTLFTIYLMDKRITKISTKASFNSIAILELAMRYNELKESIEKMENK
jgi:hypothetical protein